MASESQKIASSKYIKEKLDEIKLRVPKGQKEIIKRYAESQGVSMNEFINNAINDAMKQKMK